MKLIVLIGFFLASACACPNSFNRSNLVEESVGSILVEESVYPQRVPYLVGLLSYFKDGYGWCLGSLISPTGVLTAAQCVQGAEAVDVYVGAYNLTKRVEDGRLKITTLGRNIKIHENYDNATGENNIALIKLFKEIQFSEIIKPVNLSEPNYQEKESGFSSGWGHPWRMGWAKASFRLPENNLKNVTTQILETSNCNLISQKNICVSFPSGISTCRGDSGGPFVVYRDNIPMLVGIILHQQNVECASYEQPTFYLRVSPYLKWIENNMSNMNMKNNISNMNEVF